MEQSWDSMVQLVIIRKTPGCLGKFIVVILMFFNIHQTKHYFICRTLQELEHKQEPNHSLRASSISSIVGTSTSTLPTSWETLTFEPE